MLNQKKMDIMLLDKITPKRVVNTTYTTGTANTWSKSVTVTIDEDGLYRINAPYINSAVTGLARSATNISNIGSATMLVENSTGSSITTITYLPAGTYSIWTKCSTASKSNTLEIWKIL